jgi:hypothetical protein
VSGESVGSYAIGQGTLTAGSNYTITFVPANFTITKATPVVVTEIHDINENIIISEALANSVHDQATVSGVSLSTPTGAVSFTFYNNGICYLQGTSAGTVDLVNGVAHPSNSETLPGAGSYSFKAHYNGEANYTEADSTCEPFTLTTLIVKKVIDNSNGGTKSAADFSFLVDGGNAVAFEADGQNDLIVNAGTYSVTEPAVAGYATTYNNCSNVIIPNGGSAICTITNDDIPATLIITKDAVPNDCKDFSFTGSLGEFLLDNDEGVTDCTDGTLPKSKTVSNLSVGSYTVNETVLNFWQLGSITCVNKDTGLPFPVTVSGSGMTVSLGLAQNVECTFTNNKLGPSRTQGFWKNHTSFTTSIFQNPLELSPGFTANRIVIGTEPNAKIIDSPAKLFGAYLANVAKKSNNQKRTNVEQARIQLLHQLLTAKLNCGAFGCTPAIRTMITSADAAYSGNDVNAMNNWAGQLDAFNNSGDTIIVSPPLLAPGKATPKDSQLIANIPFWNLP